MQIVETTNEGLKRGYTLTIPASEIAGRIDAEVKRIAPQVRMPGFRPGKVPANLVRKMHGEQLHADVLNSAIRESVDQLMRERELKPAMQPQIAMGEGYTQGSDAQLTVAVEVLPQIEAPRIDGLTLERLTVPVSEDAVDEAIANIAGQQKRYEDAPEGHEAAIGDQLIVDFVGKLEGEPFEGGSAENSPLVLGSNQFIPGFEDQLTGAKAGEERTITVTFPEDYPAEPLKGREATFEVTVQAVKQAGEMAIDDEFAKQLGIESIDTLKDMVRGQLGQETAGLTRTAMKRQLLDQLAADHDFAVPPGMVDAEFEGIWRQLQEEAQGEEDTAAALKEIEDERDDYRRIAERRVRLGLLLSEIGRANGIEITAQEMQMLVNQAAQQYRPEDRERFVEYVNSEPMAAAQLRAPLYEEKVVDYLFEQAEVTEREATREELQAAIEAEDGQSGSDGGTAEPVSTAEAPADASTQEPTETAGEDAQEQAKKPARKKAAPKAEATNVDEAPKPAKKAAAKKPAKKDGAPAAADAPAKTKAAKAVKDEG